MEPFPLPSYLSPLPETDPRYAGLNASAYQYAYGPNPGDGNLATFQIVEFLDDHLSYRAWGGPASECGYWWTLAPESGCIDACPVITRADYLDDYFAICPEWNDATNITVSDIAAGTAAVVGVGQSADCADGTTLRPDPTLLQMNGPGCTLGVDGTYGSCEANPRFLQSSPCVITCDLERPALAGEDGKCIATGGGDGVTTPVTASAETSGASMRSTCAAVAPIPLHVLILVVLLGAHGRKSWIS